MPPKKNVPPKPNPRSTSKHKINDETSKRPSNQIVSKKPENKPPTNKNPNTQQSVNLKVI